jgi:hypothetical protein
MVSWAKKQKVLTGGLFLLGLLLLLNPEISRGIISISAHTPNVVVYNNYCALPSVPAKLGDNNGRLNRNNCIDRKVDQTSKGVTYFAVPNQLKQNRDYIYSEYLLNGSRYLLTFQQTCQLLDIPPPSCPVV